MITTNDLFDSVLGFVQKKDRTQGGFDAIESFLEKIREQVSVLLEKITKNNIVLEKPALYYNDLYDRVSISDNYGTYVVIDGILKVNRRDSDSLPQFVNISLEPVPAGSISNVLNDVRKTASVGLADARKLCEKGGSLKKGILLEEAEHIKEILEKGGAKVNID